MNMMPSSLLFSQTSISSNLTQGEHIPTLIRNIAYGNRGIDNSWLPLEVAQDRYDGRWYAQNNRRLYIFRVLQRLGKINSIPVKIVNMRPKPRDAGHHIRFRDGTPTEPY